MSISSSWPMQTSRLSPAGESPSVQRFFKETQKIFSLNHIGYLTKDRLAEFLGRIIKKRRSGQIIMEFSSPTFIDNLLGLLDITSRVTTMVSRFRRFPKKIRPSVIRRFFSVSRACKLLWMSQLRDDIKHPVKGFEILPAIRHSRMSSISYYLTRCSTSGSLITMFSVNVASICRTQASVPHSSAEELRALTRAS